MACPGQRIFRAARAGDRSAQALRGNRGEPRRAGAAHGHQAVGRRSVGRPERPAYEAGPPEARRPDPSERIVALGLELDFSGRPVHFACCVREDHTIEEEGTMKLSALAVALAAAGLTGAALAQSSLEKMKQMRG